MRDGSCVCEEFEGAQRIGTGGDDYEAAISISEGGYYVGNYLHEMSYCPWCGGELPTRPGDSDDTQARYPGDPRGEGG